MQVYKQQKQPQSIIQYSQQPSSMSSLQFSTSTQQGGDNMYKIMCLMREQIQISNKFYCDKMKKIIQQQAKCICQLRSVLIRNQKELLRKDAIIQQVKSSIINNNLSAQLSPSTQPPRQRAQPRKKISILSAQLQQPQSSAKVGQKIRELQKKLQVVQQTIDQKSKQQKQLNKKLDYFQKVTIKYFASKLSSSIAKLDKYFIKKEQQLETMHGKLEALNKLGQECGMFLMSDNSQNVGMNRQNINNSSQLTRKLQLSPTKPPTTQQSPQSTSSLSQSPSPSPQHPLSRTQSPATALNSKLNRLMKQMEEVRAQLHEIVSKEFTYDNCQVQRLREEIGRLRKYVDYHEGVLREKYAIQNKQKYNHNYKDSSRQIKSDNYIKQKPYNHTANHYYNPNQQHTNQYRKHTVNNNNLDLIKSQRLLHQGHPYRANQNNNGKSMATTSFSAVNLNSNSQHNSKNQTTVQLKQQQKNNKGRFEKIQKYENNSKLVINSNDKNKQNTNNAQQVQQQTYTYPDYIQNSNKLAKTNKLTSTSNTSLYPNSRPNNSSNNSNNNSEYQNTSSSKNHHNLFKNFQPENPSHKSSGNNSSNRNENCGDASKGRKEKKLEDQFYDNPTENSNIDQSVEYLVEESQCEEYEQEEFTDEEDDEEQESHNQERLLRTIHQQKLHMPIQVQIDQTGYLKCMKTGMYLVDNNDDGFELSDAEVYDLIQKGVMQVQGGFGQIPRH